GQEVQADVTASTRFVFHNKSLAQFAAQMGGNEPCRGVDTATCRNRNDNPNGFGRIGVRCLCGGRQRTASHGQRRCSHEKFHECLLDRMCCCAPAWGRASFCQKWLSE